MEMQEEEITLKELVLIIQEYWTYLLSKWKIIVVAGIAGAALGLCVSLFTKPKYRAVLSFVVNEKSAGGGLAALASSFGIGGGMGNQSLFSSLNIIEFLKTRNMVEEALLRPMREKPYTNTTYAEFYLEKNKLNDKWQKDAVLKNIHFRVGEDRDVFGRTKDSILGVIYDRIAKNELDVSQPDKENSFIQIEVISHNELFSKNFSEELTEVAADYYIESKTQTDKFSVDVLQHEVDSIQKNLYSSMGEAAVLSDKVFGLNPAMSTRRISSAKEQAQVQMNVAMLQELVKNLELAKINLLNSTPVITIAEKPIYPLEVKKIRKLKGILMGGILAEFLTVLFLFGKRYWKTLMLEG